jgi:hypothetical protein
VLFPCGYSKHIACPKDQNIDCTEISFTGRTNLIFVRYSVSHSGQPANVVKVTCADFQMYANFLRSNKDNFPFFSTETFLRTGQDVVKRT